MRYRLPSKKQKWCHCGKHYQTNGLSAVPSLYYVIHIHRPTALYVLYSMVSAQEMNLVPKIASQNDVIFVQKSISHI